MDWKPYPVRSETKEHMKIAIFSWTWNLQKQDRTKQMAQVRSYCSFIEFISVNSIRGSEGLNLQEKWLEISMDSPLSIPLKFKYKAPSSISQGDCKSSICSALIFNLKFFPFTEPCTYIKKVQKFSALCKIVNVKLLSIQQITKTE